MLVVGQEWEHKKTEERVLIEQIHRKDRQVKLRYRRIAGNKRRTWGPFDGEFEYRTFDILKKFYRLISWGAEQIEDRS